MILGVNHTGLTVGDMDLAVKFYTEALGMTVDPSRSGTWGAPFLSAMTGHPGCTIKITMVVADDGTRVQLEQFLVPDEARAVSQSWAAPGGGHVCLETKEVFAICDAVKAFGCEVLSVPPEPVPLPKESVHAGGYYLGVRDPDGHVLEILQTPRDAERWIPTKDGE